MNAALLRAGFDKNPLWSRSRSVSRSRTASWSRSGSRTASVSGPWSGYSYI